MFTEGGNLLVGAAMRIGRLAREAGSPTVRQGTAPTLPRDMQRLRDKLLRESGFVDLEGPNGDGELSDRGNLHPVDESIEEHERLAQRMGDGATYVEWAESVLHDGPRFQSREAREVWRLHAEGLSEADIATALTLTRWKVRNHLANTRRRVSEVSEVRRWKHEKRQRRAQLQALVRRCDPETLTTLVALMMRQQVPASRSASSSASSGESARRLSR